MELKGAMGKALPRRGREKAFSSYHHWRLDNSIDMEDRSRAFVNHI